MPSRIHSVQECDATKVDSSNAADKIIFIRRKSLELPTWIKNPPIEIGGNN